MNHERIQRLLRLITILQSGTKMPANALAESLGVSRRTLFRDLGILEAAGIPYEYDAKLGFRISPNFFLPPVNLKVTEAMGLMILAESANRLTDQPMMAPAIEAVNKLISLLPNSIREVCSELMSNASVRPHSISEVNRDQEMFARLHEAIDKRKICKLRYNSIFDGGMIDIELRPVHLHYAVRSWYVVGHSSMHHELRTFKLSRIVELSLTQRIFTKPRSFDPSAYFGKAWGLIPEGKVYEVVLEFSPMVGRNVSEVRWHETQEHELMADGRCIMRFEIDGLREITWWLLGYGDQVRVVKPTALRDRVKKVYTAAIQQYEKQSA